MDLCLPKMTGDAATAQLKADPSTRNIPVIVCTALHRGALTERASAAGAVEILHKPISFKVILDAETRACAASYLLGLWRPNGLRLSRAAPPPCSWTFQESEVEGCEYQDDSNVHRQPFPEPVLEEQEIDRDDHGCHQDYVECGGHPASHFSPRLTVRRSSGCLTYSVLSPKVGGNQVANPVQERRGDKTRLD